MTSDIASDLELSDGEFPDADWMTIELTHRKQDISLTFPPDATVEDLFQEVEQYLDIPVSNQKFLVPKGSMLKAPLKEPDMPLANFLGKKLMLMGSTAAQLSVVNDMCAKLAKRNAALKSQRSRAKAPRRTAGVSSAADAAYTFLAVQPLNNLPHPERSQMLLMRLKEDAGIKAVMKKHKFSVGMLTEMEPLANTETSHEGTSRTLGLNRNKGEVIELRLRTDAHDGYRDYKTIRKTLCHELAHNVHGPHDRQFWDLCHQIEREVESADYRAVGRTLDGEMIRGTQRTNGDEAHQDEGGWSGGAYVLGGVRKTSAGLNRREILANAALERQRKEDEAEHQAEKGWRPCQRSPGSGS